MAGTDAPSPAQALLFTTVETEFNTPLSHWAMHWQEWRFFSAESTRRVVGTLLGTCLSCNKTLPNGASFAKFYTWRSCVGGALARQEARWQRLSKAYLGARADVASWLHLASAWSGPKAVRLHVARRDCLTAVMLCRGRDGPTAYARRLFNFKKKTVEHAYLCFSPEQRGGKHSIRFFDAALTFYRAVGIESISLTAGLSTGGAVWGKFGFHPTDAKQWEGVKKRVRANLANIGSGPRLAFESAYAGSLEQTVLAILAMPNASALWLLCDLDKDGKLKKFEGFKHGLGSVLLQRSRWRGILNLQDRVACERLGSYLSAKLAKNQ